MVNKEDSKSQPEIVAEFPTQEAAQQVDSLLKEAGLSSLESLVKTQEAASKTTISQVKTQRNIVKGIVVGGTLGSLLGLIGCLAQLRVSGDPLFSDSSVSTTLSVSLAVGLIGAICASLVGVISASSTPTKSLPSSPKVPSNKFLVSVRGNSAEIEKAKEIIQANGGQL
jgi:hypothetical protein